MWCLFFNLWTLARFFSILLKQLLQWFVVRIKEKLHEMISSSGSQSHAHNHKFGETLTSLEMFIDITSKYPQQI